MRLSQRIGTRVGTAARITLVNLRGQADFRADFVTGILIGALWQTSIVVFAAVLLVRFPHIGTWSSPAVLLLASMRLTSHGLVTLVFGRVMHMHMLVPEGRLDAYLVRPMSVYRQVQYAFFSANAFGDLGVAIAMLVVAVGVFDLPWTLPRLVMLVGGILGGALLEAGVQTALAGLTILSPHFDSWGWRFQEVLGSSAGNYPLSILPVLAQIALTFVVPLAFIAYLPAAAVTGNLASIGVPTWLAYSAPVVGAAVYALSRSVWSACLARYQGANG